MANVIRLLGAFALILGLAACASAVVVDGVNDFPPEALIDTDGGDTEFAPIDLGDIYVTNDATNLYIGYEHDHDGWGGVQVGIALVTIASQGGTSDPWDRRIDFAGMCLPDFIAYKNIDSDYDDLVTWDEGGHSWIYGSYDLNWVVSGTFDELEIPLSQIQVACPGFHQVFIEIWVTQDANNKGPLDLSYNDALQLSTTGGTTWELNPDGSEDVVISCYWCYDVDCTTAADETSWGQVKNLWR
ncbi:MAG: hypothetical protein JW958_02520 [Candidatus Eisenbacteria bacterium]|nr:hypothetical protein [Candidatus Eisenbacteria bacterium]